MEMPGYTIREAEILLGLAYKTGYALIRAGELKAVRGDATGRLRVPYGELHAFREREEALRRAG